MMRDQQTLDDFLHNAAQAPAFERITAMMGSTVEQQTKLVKLLVRYNEEQPKSESRLAWEAVHPSWGQVFDDIMAVANNILRTGMLPLHPEQRKAGCRR